MSKIMDVLVAIGAFVFEPLVAAILIAGATVGIAAAGEMILIGMGTR